VESLVDEFEESLPFSLDPFQREAIDKLERGTGGVLVSAPTSSGKTIVAEYAIFRALREGAKVLYTTPLKVITDPRANYTPEDRKANFDLATKLKGAITDMAFSVEQMNALRSALDERASVRDVVRTLLAFNTRESCGKCTPCREGTARLLAMLDAPVDQATVKQLSEVIQLASLCGLGQAAPFAVLSGLAEFPGEFGVS